MLKKLFFILFVATCLVTKGQSIHVFKPNEQNSALVETQGHRDTMRMQDRNCFKWNWSVLARGVFLVNYEIYLAGNLTAELGVGITYRDFEFEFTKTLGSGSDTSHLVEFGGASSHYEGGIGFAGEGGLRYYFEGYDNMEGPFFQITMSYRKYNLNSTSYTNLLNTPSSFTPGYNFLDGQFKFGYAANNWINNVTTEFYVGIGIRNCTANMYESVDNPINYSSPYYEGVTIKKTYPQPILGFKMGFPF